MVWSDDRWFATCERDWQAGQFYKLRAVYDEHERYGPQVEILNIRPVSDTDREDGFDGGLRRYAKYRDLGISHWEWLVNLEELVGKGEFQFFGVPLKFKGGSGSPVRAFAILNS